MSGAVDVADGFDVDERLVRRLLTIQLPQWAELPVERWDSAGVDNAIYRLGTDMVVRLPRSRWSAAHIRKEQRWLPFHAPRLTLPVPVPLAVGTPDHGYPWHWSVYRWLDGADAVDTPLRDEDRAARDLAAFVVSLQRVPTAGGPPAGLHSGLRGVPLPVRDPVVRESLARLHGDFDVKAATAAWEAAIAVPPWRGAPVWVHSDLHPGNLLVEGGRLSAVIDWGLLNVGDPALDLMVGWTVLSATGRTTFRELVGPDRDTWLRARGWALCVGVIAFAYYQASNPVLAAMSRRAADEAVADFTAAARTGAG